MRGGRRGGGGHAWARPAGGERPQLCRGQRPGRGSLAIRARQPRRTEPGAQVGGGRGDGSPWGLWSGRGWGWTWGRAARMDTRACPAGRLQGARGRGGSLSLHLLIRGGACERHPPRPSPPTRGPHRRLHLNWVASPPHSPGRKSVRPTEGLVHSRAGPRDPLPDQHRPPLLRRPGAGPWGGGAVTVPAERRAEGKRPRGEQQVCGRGLVLLRLWFGG